MRMNRYCRFTLVFSAVWLLLTAVTFAGQDLNLAAGRLISFQPATGEHVLVFRDGFSMSTGTNQFFSDSAVIWLKTVKADFQGRVHIEYSANIYLDGNVSFHSSPTDKSTDLDVCLADGSEKLQSGTKYDQMVVRFDIKGQVFASAQERQQSDPRKLELYKKAQSAILNCKPEVVTAGRQVEPEKSRKPKTTEKPEKPGFFKQIFEHKAEPVKPKPKQPRFRYPVNIAPAGKVEPEIEWDDLGNIGTVIGRFYLSQKLDEHDQLLELQADTAVIFGSKQPRPNRRNSSSDELLVGQDIVAIYLSGDVVMTQGQRTIRADEIYYDFQRKRAIAINAVMRNFDVKRKIPIYVRAAKIKTLAENQFTAKDITLTSSEFYQPQISATASDVIITDTTAVDAQLKNLSDSSVDILMKDVRLKAGERTIFYLPVMRGNMQRPDIPLKRAHLGYDNTWGMSLESQWYLSRLLGLRQPKGADSTLELDYYSKRGFGSGATIDYKTDNYFGGLTGYIIHDTGEDRLGRNDDRKDLKPPRELRGRFKFKHRHFLPYNWQFTTETSYASDENFIESFYRDEFTTDLQETYVHLKRLEDNWALSLLGKVRLNDFADEREELPGIGFHLTGQSLFDDRFTLYNDTEIGRLRQRIGNDHSTLIDEDHFSFVSHRTELDMPIRLKSQSPVKIVPFLAGTFGYDDRSGFTRSLVDGRNTGSSGDDQVWIAEAGVRVFPGSYHKVYPDAKSKLWDLNQLRHIIKPTLTAVLYDESDHGVAQRDMLNIGLSQRLQTRRGPIGKEQTVDWMRLNMDMTWVDDSSHDAAGSGPDRFIWNRPMTPLRVLSAPDIFNGDLSSSLHRFEMFGPRRNYFSTDYMWRLSESSAISGDMYFDIQSSVVQQLNIGFSRMSWPNLSYYIGSRYLRRVEVLDEKGSNVFTFAAAYKIDPRYTAIFSQQFDFDYGKNSRSNLTLIRRYHRIFCSISVSTDASLDRQSIVLGIWPQGVPELALGPRRYMGLGGPENY